MEGQAELGRLVVQYGRGQHKSFTIVAPQGRMTMGQYRQH